MFEKFAKYIGVAGVLALALTAAVITLALEGKAVPEVLTAALAAVTGFYFGSKGEKLAAAFTAWAWWAIPEWRRDRAMRDDALQFLEALQAAYGDNWAAEDLREASQIFEKRQE